MDRRLCRFCNAEIAWVDITDKYGNKKKIPVNIGYRATVVTKKGIVINGLQVHYDTCKKKRWSPEKRFTRYFQKNGLQNGDRFRPMGDIGEELNSFPDANEHVNAGVVQDEDEGGEKV